MPTLRLQIGTHRFKVSVSENDKERMVAAARRVEEMLRRYSDVDRVADGERAAVMVALQMASSAISVDEMSLAEVSSALDEALAAASAE